MGDDSLLGGQLDHAFNTSVISSSGKNYINLLHIKLFEFLNICKEILIPSKQVEADLIVHRS